MPVARPSVNDHGSGAKRNDHIGNKPAGWRRFGKESAEVRQAGSRTGWHRLRGVAVGVGVAFAEVFEPADVGMGEILEVFPGNAVIDE